MLRKFIPPDGGIQEGMTSITRTRLWSSSTKARRRARLQTCPHKPMVRPLPWAGLDRTPPPALRRMTSTFPTMEDPLPHFKVEPLLTRRHLTEPQDIPTGSLVLPPTQRETR